LKKGNAVKLHVEYIYINKPHITTKPHFFISKCGFAGVTGMLHINRGFTIVKAIKTCVSCGE